MYYITTSVILYNSKLYTLTHMNTTLTAAQIQTDLMKLLQKWIQLVLWTWHWFLA